ncbi:MAG: RNA polymerase sigma factor SigV [Candidatus Hydrogenedentes bacterium ADurb.Bin179]|jgi:RNA polymerase sigma-70 factor (ECF subfamily)|nr:MAG: RNA polymerase sigma factor SigV [Candidatus Hydrogenedentes bacterium ADurb.Bin179]
MRHTDEELVFRCLDGDTEAFAALVQRYQHAVYATAYHYAGRYGGAEDISQEAFWAAFRSLPQIREPEHFGAWLKGITTRVAANWLRRNAPRLRYETPLPRRRAFFALDPESAVRDGDSPEDLYEAVHRAVDALPERYQLPVVLRYVQEMSYEEISRFTGESYDEIRGILNRAGRMLRETLQQERIVQSQHRNERQESG